MEPEPRLEGNVHFTGPLIKEDEDAPEIADVDVLVIESKLDVVDIKLPDVKIKLPATAMFWLNVTPADLLTIKLLTVFAFGVVTNVPVAAP